MKITMLRSPSRALGCDLKEGQTGEVDDKLATALINSGIAIPVAAKASAMPKPKALEGVPSTTTVKGE